MSEPAKKIDLFGSNKPVEVRQKERANEQIERANALVVKTEADANAVTPIIKDIKTLIKQIEEHHAPMKSKAHEAWKAIVAAEKALVDPLKEAITILNKKQSDYLLELDKQRCAEQERIDRERAAKEKAIREKAAALVNDIMKDDVSLAEKIEILEGRFADDTTDETTATVLRAAIRGLELAQESGVSAEEAIAEEVEVAAVTDTPATVQEEAKLDGVVKRLNFDVEVIDMVALCKAIGEGKVPPGVVKVAQGPLNAHAKAMQGADIPGCKVIKKLKTHTRG
jgi:Txe/YoeB family toxin of Txe-Axe toxin-antitoxin module